MDIETFADPLSKTCGHPKSRPIISRTYHAPSSVPHFVPAERHRGVTYLQNRDNMQTARISQKLREPGKCSCANFSAPSLFDGKTWGAASATDQQRSNDRFQGTCPWPGGHLTKASLHPSLPICLHQRVTPPFRSVCHLFRTAICITNCSDTRLVTASPCRGSLRLVRAPFARFERRFGDLLVSLSPDSPSSGCNRSSRSIRTGTRICMGSRCAHWGFLFL
jgi:hypothetical protein